MAASASAAEFHSEAATTTIDGSQKTKIKFVTEAGTVECSGVSFSGTQSGATAKSVTVTPSYSGCTAFGFATAHVEVTGCTMTFNSDTSSSLNCGATGHIIITPTFIIGSVCTVTIGGNQSFGKGAVEYTNVGNPKKSIRMHLKHHGLVYISSGNTSCGSEGTHSDGTMEGSVELTGTQPANTQVGIWWE